MAPKYRRVRFPLWLYLNQPLFDPNSKAVINPYRFWNLYQIRYLERCLERQYRPEERLQ